MGAAAAAGERKRKRDMFGSAAMATVGLKTITDRADDTILNLPPLTHHFVDFDAEINSEYMHADIVAYHWRAPGRH
eukprot:4132821-Prymnesium_polylepis.1